MTLVPCPSCGQAVSHLAEACVHCGYDLVVAPAAAAVPASPRRVRRGKLVTAALAGAVAVLAVLGSFAAMASSRLHSFAATTAAGEGGGEGEAAAVDALSTVLELEQEHFAHHGAYTANLARPWADDHLEGWEASMAPAGYDLRVVEADTTELCVQAAPRAGAAEGARTMTIDEQGSLRESEGCGGEIAIAPSFAAS